MPVYPSGMVLAKIPSACSGVSKVSNGKGIKISSEKMVVDNVRF
jgi:hypothetical protein